MAGVARERGGEVRRPPPPLAAASGGSHAFWKLSHLVLMERFPRGSSWLVHPVLVNRKDDRYMMTTKIIRIDDSSDLRRKNGAQELGRGSK